MRTTMTLSILFLSAACATPTLANYLHNPYTNLNLNIGSARSPTLRDIRENHLPRVVQAAPSDHNVVAHDTTKNTDKPAANDHPPAQGGGGKNMFAAQLSR
jgi:hypothetical protein